MMAALYLLVVALVALSIVLVVDHEAIEKGGGSPKSRGYHQVTGRKIEEGMTKSAEVCAGAGVAPQH